MREAVESGKVLLEWDDSKGTAPLPVLKNVFANERRRAKVLNFSIAYGKTAVGLAKDWKVETKDAQVDIHMYAHAKTIRQFIC